MSASRAGIALLLAVLTCACGGVRSGGSSTSGGSTGTDGTSGTDGSSGTGTTGTTGTTGGSTGGRPGPYHVLFDSAHRQVESNACWVVDSSSPSPTPATPHAETDWSGGISAWGFALFQSGRYQIKQVPTGTALRWGGGGAGDLQAFDVFISDEPEAAFTAAEQSALWSFAQAGKGIFLISDHAGAARCGACTESWQVLNGFLTTGAGSGFGVKCDGNEVATHGATGNPSSTPLGQTIAHGPFGSGTSFVFHSGSTVSLTGTNPAAEVVIQFGSGGMMAAAPLSTGGRLILVGDSSPADDGTSTCSGAVLENGWGEFDDGTLLLNATAWLAHDGS